MYVSLLTLQKVQTRFRKNATYQKKFFSLNKGFFVINFDILKPKNDCFYMEKVHFSFKLLLFSL